VLVNTDMADFIKQSIPAEEMLRTSDIAEAPRFVLRISPNCVVRRSCSSAPAVVLSVLAGANCAALRRRLTG
jgi:hypothetical protein